MMVINILTLPQRKAAIVEEIQKHGLTAIYWDGFTDDTPKKNISKGHKRIVQFAKDNEFPSVVVAEDDMRLYGKGAYQYFLDHTPDDYDIFLSSLYTGEPDEKNELKNFRGLTLYRVHERYYDTFLNCSDENHIDAALSRMGGKFVVVDKFCTYQAPGFSYQRNKYVNDNARHKGKPIYTEP